MVREILIVIWRKDYEVLFLCIQDDERELLKKQFFVLQFWGHIVDATLLYMFLKGEQ